jgi:hypothetical protein
MRRSAYGLIAGLCLGLAPAAWGEGQTPPGTCGSYGTAVEFVGSPKEAAQQAEKEQKLVLVLHVSGHFEDPGIT